VKDFTSTGKVKKEASFLGFNFPTCKSDLGVNIVKIRTIVVTALRQCGCAPWGECVKCLATHYFCEDARDDALLFPPKLKRHRIALIELFSRQDYAEKKVDFFS